MERLGEILKLNRNFINESYEFEYKVIAFIDQCREDALTKAVWRWANENNAHEVIVMGEEKLKEVLKLGMIAYANKAYKEAEE